MSFQIIMVKGVKAMTQRSKLSLPSSGTLDALIYRIASGDTQGLDTLYRFASPGVYAYALSVLKNSHDAEDVLQDTFLRIHDAAATYRSQDKPMAWILTITRNLCFKHLQQQQKAGHTPIEEWRDYLGIQESTAQEDKALIQACMEILTDEDRQILVLHAVAGFKHREIAKLLGLKLSTVLSKYHRAIKKMKENF